MCKKIFIYILSTISILTLSSCVPTESTYNEFAKCITSKGVVMYGTYWCHNCIAQKALFGGSFQYIKYIECDPYGQNNQSNLCLKKGILSYPTWEFPDKSKKEGLRPLEELAKTTNCELKADAPTPPLTPNK